MAVNPSIVDCPRPGSTPDDVLFRFVIIDAPTPSTLPVYVRELHRLGVGHLVRVCGPTYRAEAVERSGIAVHGLPFDDGAPPPPDVVEQWFALLDGETRANPPAAIAVHCVAGLGRAPVLVALALVEYGGIPALDAVAMVRARRRGAINQVQLHWLAKYKPRHLAGKDKGCLVM